MGKRAETMQAAVLAALQSRGAPLSAYQILEILQQGGRRLAPTTIYRALAALTAERKIHRLETRNAFVACRGGCGDAATILAVCDECGAVEETMSEDVLAALSSITGAKGFAPSRHVIEITGQCAECGPRGEKP